MYRTISRFASLALFAGMAIASVLNSAGSAIARSAVYLYELAGAWMFDAVKRMPAPMASPHEPADTATQRTWLIASTAYQARQDAKRTPAIERGWCMCPST